MRRPGGHGRHRKHRGRGAGDIPGRSGHALLALADGSTRHGHQVCRGHTRRPLPRARQGRTVARRTDVHHQERPRRAVSASGPGLRPLRHAGGLRNGQCRTGRRDIRRRPHPCDGAAARSARRAAHICSGRRGAGGAVCALCPLRRHGQAGPGLRGACAAHGTYIRSLLPGRHCCKRREAPRSLARHFRLRPPAGGGLRRHRSACVHRLGRAAGRVLK